ncbi:MAG: hypothetical protein OEY49_18425 [Candidatus Heimdallarchaeota archaeon]|nr:hypothetical protein [Candidatus Heimdallarchaeota archaeon]
MKKLSVLVQIFRSILFFIAFTFVVIIPSYIAIKFFIAVIKAVITPALRKPVPRWKLDMKMYEEGDNKTLFNLNTENTTQKNLSDVSEK